MSDTSLTVSTQVSAADLVVTPTGGVSDTLANHLAKNGSANTILAGQSRTITRASGTAQNSDFAIRQDASLSGVATTTPFANYFTTSSDGMDCTTAGVGGNTFIRHNFGTGAKGCRYALQAWVVQVNTSANVSDVYAQYVGGQFSFFGSHNDGGTANTPGNSRGFGFGINAQCLLGAGATNWSGLFGAEIDLSVETGASVRGITGVLVQLKGDHAVHGADGIDAAFVVGTDAGASTWFDYGLSIGRANQTIPIMSKGTLIIAPSAGTVANGVDFSAVNFTNAAFKSKGFCVDGSGNIQSVPLVSRNFLNDIAAASGGVKVGELYHTNGAVRVRLA